MNILEFTRSEFDTAIARSLKENTITNDTDMLELLTDNDGDTPFEQLSYYLSEMSPETRAALNEFGFIWGTDNIRIDLDRIPSIEELTMAVHDEYDRDDNDDDDDDNESGGIWDELGLSSDDDVDYNSGYIETALELINLYRIG